MKINHKKQKDEGLYYKLSPGKSRIKLMFVGIFPPQSKLNSFSRRKSR